ncbi:uncharacterized protein LOC144118655 isoform X2 [Amblyomma americanum]
MAASAMCSALVLLGATLVHSTGAEESMEEKLSCVYMQGSSAVRQCIANLFRDQGLNLGIQNALPLPEGVSERVRILAVGCLAVRVFFKAHEYGCAPAQSIRDAYDCVYTYEEKKEELLNAFNVRSSEDYLQFAGKIEACQGSFTANKKNARQRYFRKGVHSASNNRTRAIRAVEEAAAHASNKTV